MRPRLLAFVVLSHMACHPILGIEDRDLDPIRVGVCELPTQGDARVRFANLAPNDVAVDVCLTRAGASPGRGVLRGAGTSCPAGFRYAEVSRTFAMPSGTYDVKVVKYGARCDGSAIAEARGVAIAASKTTTLAQISDGASTIKSFADGSKLTPGTIAVRFVHAIPGVPALDMGIAADGRPPTTLVRKLLERPVAFGASSAGNAAATFTVNPDGYAQLPTTGVNIGAAATGTAPAMLAIGLPQTDAVRTLYAIGDPRQPLLPVRGLLCDDLAREGNPLSSCTLSSLSTLSVDMISAGLFGGVAKIEGERRGPLFDQIGKREADLVCVSQIGRRADKAELIARVKSRFPYAVNVNTDLDTKPTDDKLLSGVSPPLPTTPACGGAADPAKAKALLDCLSTKCTDTGTDEGKLKSSGSWSKPNSDCLSEACASQYLSLLSGDTPAQSKAHARCFGCTIATFLSDKPMREVREFCTNNPRDGLSFDGETPSLLLSRFAIREQDTFILPSTTYQRAVHFARVEIEPGKELDFYCGHTNSNFGSLVPYGGRFSSKLDAGGWLEERALQVKRLSDWIKSKSGKRALLLAGEWDSSNEIKDAAGGIAIEAREPDVVDALEAIFQHAIPKGKVPECTMCPDNPLGASTQKALTTRIYTLNFPPDSATELSVFFKEPIVPVPDGLAHLSGLYGLNVQVKRP